MLHCNGVLSGGVGTVRVGGLPVEKRHLAEIRRRVGIVFQDPDDQLFMPTVRDDVAFGPTNFGVRGAELDAACRRGARGGRDGRVRRPHPAPSQLRAAPARRGRDRPRVSSAAAGPRRALVEPRSRQPARARRHRAQPRRDAADGHPRPALRARAVSPRGRDRRRCDRRRRPDRRDPLRSGADGGPPVGVPGRTRRQCASCPRCGRRGRAESLQIGFCGGAHGEREAVIAAPDAGAEPRRTAPVVDAAGVVLRPVLRGGHRGRRAGASITFWRRTTSARASSTTCWCSSPSGGHG